MPPVGGGSQDCLTAQSERWPVPGMGRVDHREWYWESDVCHNSDDLWLMLYRVITERGHISLLHFLAETEKRHVNLNTSEYKYIMIFMLIHAKKCNKINQTVNAQKSFMIT